MKKVFLPFLFLLFSLAIFSCNNETAKVEDNEPKSAEVAQDSSQKEEVAKAAEKTLLGKWSVVQTESKGTTENFEKGALVFIFEKDGKLNMINEQDNSTSKYELIEEENIIKVTNTDDAPETWTIKEWDEKTLIFTANSPDGEEISATLKR